MTDSELDQLVVHLDVEIQLYPESDIRKFRTFNELKEYIARDEDFWRPVGIKEIISGFVEAAQALREAEASSNRNFAQTKLINATTRLSSSPRPFHSSTAEGKFLKEGWPVC